MGDGPSDVAIADFNGDNKTDIVATNHWQGQVRIRWGSTNWSTYTSYSTGQKPWRISTADLNDDGLDDFATTNFVGGANDDTITVRLRLAGGGFSNTTYSAGPAASDIKFGDCNNDGDLDMFYPTGFNNNTSIRVRQNNGNGSFGPAGATNVAQGDNSQVMAITLENFNLTIHDFGPSGNDGVSVRLNQARLWNGDLELGFDSGAGLALTAVRAGETDRTGVSSLALKESGRSISFGANFETTQYTVEYNYDGAVVLTEQGVPSGSQATQVLLDELQCLLEGSPSYLCNLIIEFQQNNSGECEWTVTFSQAASIEPRGGGDPILVDAIRLVEEEEETHSLAERMAFSEIPIQGATISSLVLNSEKTELERDLSMVYLPAIVK